MRLGALLEAITKKEAVDQMKIKTLSKLKDDKITVEKLGAGKFMITQVFKGQAGKASETQKLLAAIA
jgi:hypothetical protein